MFLSLLWWKIFSFLSQASFHKNLKCNQLNLSIHNNSKPKNLFNTNAEMLPALRFDIKNYNLFWRLKTFLPFFVFVLKKKQDFCQANNMLANSILGFLKVWSSNRKSLQNKTKTFNTFLTLKLCSHITNQKLSNKKFCSNSVSL